jgi:mannonate dehydratase
MEQTMRWFGPKDTVSLTDILQAGATGIVTALHHIPNGQVWPVEEINQRKLEIERAATHAGQPMLRWSVVESVPVHEAIKTGHPDRQKYIQHYQQTLRNLAQCGIATVCYNFMPVLDWSRTDLGYELPDGSKALRFVEEEFAAFDLFILGRPGAEASYSEATVQRARAIFASLTPEQSNRLTRNIIAGLPGSEESFSLAQFQAVLDTYQGISDQQLRENLYDFLRQVAPLAQELGINLAIHPDDPPRPLLGLPRVVSTEADLTQLLQACDLPANGFTMCTGSYGVRPDNDLAGMVARHGEKMHFIHLRATKREPENPHNFHEADHLTGDVDMFAVVRAIVQEQRRRASAGSGVVNIPMRPDHGHQMLDDLRKSTAAPGYTAIGRLRGLAEIRGLQLGIERMLEA